jgi:hypothetical protein
MADQIPILGAAMGAQTPQQLHGLEQVGFALAVATDHQQARRLDGQAQLAVVAELAELQAMQPNGSLTV